VLPVGREDGEVDEREQRKAEDGEEEHVVLPEVAEELEVLELLPKERVGVREADVLGEGVRAELDRRLQARAARVAGGTWAGGRAG